MRTLNFTTLLTLLLAATLAASCGSSKSKKKKPAKKTEQVANEDEKKTGEGDVNKEAPPAEKRKLGSEFPFDDKPTKPIIPSEDKCQVYRWLIQDGKIEEASGSEFDECKGKDPGTVVTDPNGGKGEPTKGEPTKGEPTQPVPTEPTYGLTACEYPANKYITVGGMEFKLHSYVTKYYMEQLARGDYGNPMTVYESTGQLSPISSSFGTNFVMNGKYYTGADISDASGAIWYRGYSWTYFAQYASSDLYEYKGRLLNRMYDLAPRKACLARYHNRANGFYNGGFPILVMPGLNR